MKPTDLRDTQTLKAMLQARGLHDKGATVKAALFAQAAAALPGNREMQAFFVPGRIEVLGKHTDYAGGRSLVTAVEQGFCLVASSRAEAQLSVQSVQTGEQVEFAFDGELVARHGHWSNYPMTVARRLARNFPNVCCGADIAFISDLPPASGMSSSSAMMVATYLALAAIGELEKQPVYQRSIQDKLALAAYLGTVENGQTFGELVGDRGVGTFGGSEDHTAILCSQAGRLGQFSYCPACFERYIELPEGHVFAVGFSGVVAEKTGAAQQLYNQAAQRVSAIVEVWRRATGRADLYLADILASSPPAAGRLRQLLADEQVGDFSNAELIQRLDHFVAENEEIVAPAGQALAAGDLEGFGRLVDRSQELTESLLGNQVPQTAALAKLARERGALAASAFGAGFGGSVWALIDASSAQTFLQRWSAAYRQAFPQAASGAQFFTTQAGPAAFELKA